MHEEYDDVFSHEARILPNRQGEHMIIETLIVGPLGTNCYIVSSGKEAKQALVIDPGAKPEAIQEALAGREAAAVLLTHGHFDHTGALWFFEGTPIYIHPADDIMLTDSAWSMADWVQDRRKRPAATHFVQEGNQLSLAGLEITVLHLPGHSKGSVAYAIGNTLFSGDTMFKRGVGRTDLPGGDGEELARSVRRLLQLPGNWVICPGHGEQTTLEEERTFYS